MNRGFRGENTLGIVHEPCFGRKSSVRYILSEGSQNILEVLKEMTAVMCIINEDDAEQRKNRDKWVKKPICVIHGRWAPCRTGPQPSGGLQVTGCSACKKPSTWDLKNWIFLDKRKPDYCSVWTEFMSGGVGEQAGRRSTASKGRFVSASVISPAVLRKWVMNVPVHFRWKQSSYAQSEGKE